MMVIMVEKKVRQNKKKLKKKTLKTLMKFSLVASKPKREQKNGRSSLKRRKRRR
jgi:hypothetical protein